MGNTSRNDGTRISGGTNTFTGSNLGAGSQIVSGGTFNGSAVGPGASLTSTSAGAEAAGSAVLAREFQRIAGEISVLTTQLGAALEVTNRVTEELQKGERANQYRLMADLQAARAIMHGTQWGAQVEQLAEYIPRR